MSNTAKREIGLGIVILLFATAVAFIAIPVGIDMPSNITVRALSPNFWPFIVIAMTGLAGVAILAHGISDLRKFGPADTASNTPSTATDTEERPFLEALFRVAIVVIVLFTFYLAIPLTGIVFTSSVVLAFLCYFAGERRWRIILPIAILLPVLLYVFFVHLANVPLPLGVFEAFR